LEMVVPRDQVVDVRLEADEYLSSRIEEVTFCLDPDDLCAEWNTDTPVNDQFVLLVSQSETEVFLGLWLYLITPSVFVDYLPTRICCFLKFTKVDLPGTWKFEGIRLSVKEIFAEFEKWPPNPQPHAW